MKIAIENVDFTFYYVVSCVPTVPMRTDLTESKPKLKPEFTFGVYTGFTRADPE